MASNEPLSALDISASALSAEQARMRVIALNIANANTLVTPEGGPYQRREVTFSTVVKDEFARPDDPAAGVGGVKIASVKVGKEPVKAVYDPDHPLADKDGFVKAPNVNVASEMVDMVQAQRSCEANLAAMKAYRDMLRNSIQILRR